MRVSARAFSEFLLERYAAKDGYIMGATGQCPRGWKDSSWWIAQYKDEPKKYEKAKYWRDHAERVWDCNGMAEGYYHDITGVNINTKARFNYAQWCGQKGAGVIPSQYRMAGAAVFWGKSAATITHVAFLVAPVEADKPDGDWWMVEARSVLLGVCKTKLLTRRPEWWGIMDKYFDYGAEPEPEPEPGRCPYAIPTKTVRRGMKGESVLWVQWHLLLWDSGSLPRYGLDGSFGAETDRAVREYQDAKGLKVDGLVGTKTIGAMIADEDWYPTAESEIDPNYVEGEEHAEDAELLFDDDGNPLMTPDEAAAVARELGVGE